MIISEMYNLLNLVLFVAFSRKFYKYTQKAVMRNRKELFIEIY